MNNEIEHPILLQNKIQNVLFSGDSSSALGWAPVFVAEIDVLNINRGEITL